MVFTLQHAGSTASERADVAALAARVGDTKLVNEALESVQEPRRRRAVEDAAKAYRAEHGNGTDGRRLAGQISDESLRRHTLTVLGLHEADAGNLSVATRMFHRARQLARRDDDI